MNATKVTKKAILSNPVKIFVQTFPNAQKEQIATLTHLQNNHVKLKVQFKDKQNECKKTSRLIGEAKRNQQSTDKLIEAMLKQTANVNDVKTLLNNSTDNILAFFKDTEDFISSDKQTIASTTRTHNHQAYDGGQISITLLNEDDGSWNQYVKSNRDASIYHYIEWKKLIQNVFGHECYYFYATNTHKQIVGVLPLVRLKSRLFGDFLVSMPYFNSGSAIADTLSVEQKLIETANKHAGKIGVNHVEYRDNIPREGLAVRTEKVNMILSLPETQEILWGTFTSKLRSQIRRPQRERTHVSIGGIECLNDFYTVFAQNMRDLGTPVYGKSFFTNIIKAFPQHSKIVVIQLNHRPVAAAFLLGDKNMLEIPWASTIKNVNHLSINMLLYWEVLKFAIQNHYKYFDFGRSSKDSGTFRFKQQWGAKPKQQFWHYWLPDHAELPKLNPSNPKFALVINVWKRLPIALTKAVGPFIVKNLP